MKIKLFNDNKGVSPVIGVMMMIVVTVILAGAVSSFASSTDVQETAPQATFTASASMADGYITLNHLGGDTIYHTNVKAEIKYGTPTMSTLVNSSAFTFEPDSEYLGPGDIAKISFDWYDTDTYAATGNLTDAEGALFDSVAVMENEPFVISIIDTDTDQTVYSTKIVLNP